MTRRGDPTQHYGAIDPWVLYHAAGEDLETYRILSQTFLDIAPPMFDRLRLALDGGDPGELLRAGHALRGTVSLVGAVALEGVLNELERGARAGEMAPPPPGLAAMFAQVVQEVLASIAAFDGGAGGAGGAGAGEGGDGGGA